MTQRALDHPAPRASASAVGAGHAHDTTVTTLGNGARVVAIRMPHLETASVSVFVQCGSQHESARQNGIGHVVEHMAFKGTASRDCQRINLDAERLGADVNAHTDKDHTAFHMSGLAKHAGLFVQMLGDIVRESTFPEVELERERQVILHEIAEEEDDALSTVFTLFDKTCFGAHAVAQPVIGMRRNIERFTRSELMAHVQQHYTAANVVIGIAGHIDADEMARGAEAAFASMPRGDVNTVEAPTWLGGIAARRQTGSSQTHVAFGYPIPDLSHDDLASTVAASVFGEGMSSPLLDEIRERRGLAYHAACSADLMALAGQFVIEATTTPEHLDEFFGAVARLLHAHAVHIDAVALERARNQLAVRTLRSAERPLHRIESAARSLFVRGRVQSHDELMAGVMAVGVDDVRHAFERMLAAKPAIAIAGKLGKGSSDRFLDQVEAFRHA